MNKQAQPSAVNKCPVGGCNPKSPIFLSCSAVLVTLIVALPLFGYFSYTVLHGHEDRTFRALFDSLTDDIFLELNESLLRIQYGSGLLADYAGFQNPNSEDWPNASIPFYGTMNDNGEKLSASRFAMMPIVLPEEVAGFEQHSREVFADTPLVPDNAGENSFGYGIFKFENGQRVHDVTGETTFSDKNILTPVLYSAFPEITTSFLFNLHSTVDRAKVMDGVIDCADSVSGRTCIALSDIIQTISSTERYLPNTLFYQPIYPMNNKTDIVGFLTVGFKWDVILEGSLSETLENVMVIVASAERKYTFELIDGKSHLRGEGDLHDEHFDSLKRELKIQLIGEAESSVPYTIYVYPTKQFYDEYHSDIPVIWTSVGLGVIIAITLLFITYDRLVKADSVARELILEQKRKFVRLISHEIRTPLNTVKMGLQLQEEVVSECESCKEMKCLASEIMASTEVAITVLNDLLNFDKIEMGKLSIEVKEVMIWDLIREVVHLFSIEASNKNVSLSLICNDGDAASDNQVQGPTVMMLGDALKLSQTIRNLISNALKFSSAGGFVSVMATWRKNGLSDSALLTSDYCPASKYHRSGSILLSVKDNGPGISIENQKNLFGEGQQFNANELQGGQGSGLGLFISKGIVELHNGRIWAESEGEGKGTCFFVELPVAMPSESKLAAERNSLERSRTLSLTLPCKIIPMVVEEKQIEEEIVSAKGKILVVDDSTPNRKMLCRLLSKRGFTCDTAQNGQELLDIMDKSGDGEYSCVLLDNHMPIMNGSEAALILRGKGSKIPIFGLTGSVMKEDMEQFLKSGVNCILEKPLDIEQFDMQMKRHCNALRCRDADSSMDYAVQV